MKLVRRAKRWWRKQLIVNPGRINSWLVGLFGILATVVAVAVFVRFIG